jgi:hypothetical protein
MKIPEWKAVTIIVEGNAFFIGDANVWDKQWQRVSDSRITLPHPSYSGQTHDFDVYSMPTDAGPVMFATAEVSANVWAFYVPNVPC